MKKRKILFINRRARKFRVGVFNTLYQAAKKEGFEINFLFIHPFDFERGDTIFDYKTSKEKYLFGIKKEHFSIDLNSLKYIDDKIDMIVLPAPDHPLATLEFLKLYKRAKRLKKKTVLWWNPPNWKEKFFKKVWWSIRRTCFKNIFKKVDVIITYCEPGKETFVEDYGIKKGKIFVATNSLDNKEVIKKSEEFIKNGSTEKLKKIINPKNKKVIIFVGKLTAGKNLDSLFVAMKMVLEKEKTILIIMGDGNYRMYLEDLAKKLKIEKDVIFLGENRKDPEKIINAADLAVLPGLGGLSLNHLMLCGKPVISSKADGTPLDLIENGKNGFLLEKNTSDELAEKILLLIENDKLRLKMGKVAKKTIQKKASLDLMAQVFIKAFKSQLGEDL